MKFTINEFNKQYPNDDACLDEIFQSRFGHIKECPKCKKNTKFNRVIKRKCYCCQFCGYQLHPVANTIFHKSDTPLTKWFYALYLFSVSKNGVSAMELQRHLGVTYKTAWRMAKQIRLLFENNQGMLKGIVEIDETYFGGKDNHQGFRKDSKTPIVGMVERKGDIFTKVTTDTKTKTVMPLIRNHVKLGAYLMTDHARMYDTLHKQGYMHSSVNHMRKEYARGITHTNTIEGFWGQLKRSISGTYHMVSPKYLQSYVDEFSFRYNSRFSSEPLFSLLLARVVKQS